MAASQEADARANHPLDRFHFFQTSFLPDDPGQINEADDDAHQQTRQEEPM